MMMTFVLESVSKVCSPTQILLHLSPSPANLIPSQFPHAYNVGNAYTVSKDTPACPNAGLLVAQVYGP